jgi:hypothetical protein
MTSKIRLRAILIPCLLLAAALTASAQDAEKETQEDIPDGVEMLMKRGGIPAIFEPEFVPADEAELPDDAWIFGVEIGGVAKAYSLNLLNHHEVVNDESGGQPFATVW